MGFDIMSLQKGRGPVQARSKADEGRAVLKYIDVDDLVPSEDNFYSMSAIEELASLIELSGGVKQPALVVPLGGGEYKVIAGHRRRLASIQLVKQGKEAYRKMPCMVEDGEREPGADADELRAIDEAILLITTNGQRDKTDWDKVQEATRLRALLDRKRQFEKIPGETRRLIAERLGTTPAQVGRYDSIAKHLLPEFKALLETGKINISVAYELSTMTEEEQNEVLDENGTEGRLSIEDVKRKREKMRAPKPSTEERDKPEAAEDGPKYKPGVYVREAETKTHAATPAPIKDGDSVVLFGFGELDGKHTAKNTGSGSARTAEGLKLERKQEPLTTENDGKIVDFPAPTSPQPAETEQGEKDVEWAALMLETLRMSTPI